MGWMLRLPHGAGQWWRTSPRAWSSCEISWNCAGSWPDSHEQQLYFEKGTAMTQHRAPTGMPESMLSFEV